MIKSKGDKFRLLGPIMKGECIDLNFIESLSTLCEKLTIDICP